MTDNTTPETTTAQDAPAETPTHITPDAAEQVQAHGLLGRVQHALTVGSADAIKEAREALTKLQEFFAKKDTEK
jgi:hypothetical protein